MFLKTQEPLLAQGDFLEVWRDLPDKRNVIEGAAGLRAPLFSRVRRAGLVVGPGRWGMGAGGRLGEGAP